MSRFVLGEFHRTLDDRFRLSIPSELATSLPQGEGARCMLAKERPGALSLWSAEDWGQRLDNDVAVIQVMDGAELDFPFRNPTLFKGLEQFPEVLADPKSLRKAYLREFEGFCSELRKGCRNHGMDYQLIPTDQPLDVTLFSYLTSREARLK